MTTRLKHKMPSNPNKRPFVLPSKQRVMINLKLNSTHPKYAIAVPIADMPFRENKWDLILMPEKNYYLFENRWRWFNEVIDYRAVQFWDARPFDLYPQSLRRVKICGLPNELSPKAQTDLLKCLGQTAVQQLEIDLLELLENSTTDLTFSSLRLLSVDAIRTVTDDGRESTEMALIRLVTPELETLCLGPNSKYSTDSDDLSLTSLKFSGSSLIDYIEFVSCKDLLRLQMQGVPSPTELRRSPFRNLEVLVCNQYRFDCSAVVRQIARGTLLPQLKVLCCDFSHLDSTSYKLNMVARVLIRELYQSLVADHAASPLRADLRIYIHGLLFDPEREYNACGYHLKLIDFHHSNLQENCELRPCASVAKADYLDAMSTFFSEEHIGANRFFTYYPNLRIIVLENRTLQKIPAHNVISFLRFCSGLTELELRFGNFSQLLYDRIVDLPSMAPLNSLVVLEQPVEFRHRIDFVHLVNRFVHLRNLHSNVVTRSMMLQLFRTMEIGCHFIFDFWIRDRTFHRVTLLRRHHTYNLLVASHNHQFTRELYRRTFTSLDNLLKSFIKVNPQFPLYHWLDVLPAKKNLLW